MFGHDSPKQTEFPGPSIGNAPVLDASLWLVLLAIGLWLSTSALVPVLMHSAHDYTHPVRAQVVESHIEGRSNWLGLGARSVFSYRYFHQGRLFRSSAYRPGGHLDEAVRAHPPGSSLTAYLDPNRPEYAMVWPDPGRTHMTTLVLGLSLVLLGGVGAGLSLSRRPLDPARETISLDPSRNDRA
ncbi:hypothetical protein AY599_18055 [Leptolyngbya valderiana BDU 20041]|nr:hypothetical protein AY599_18055 [Leptolyngbya valderiana BDU 20041]